MIVGRKIIHTGHVPPAIILSKESASGIPGILNGWLELESGGEKSFCSKEPECLGKARGTEAGRRYKIALNPMADFLLGFGDNIWESERAHKCIRLGQRGGRFK